MNNDKDLLEKLEEVKSTPKDDTENRGFVGKGKDGEIVQLKGDTTNKEVIIDSK